MAGRSRKREVARGQGRLLVLLVRQALERRDALGGCSSIARIASADTECFGYTTTYDDAGCLATYGEFNKVPLIKVTPSSKDSTKGVRIGFVRPRYVLRTECVQVAAVHLPRAAAGRR